MCISLPVPQVDCNIDILSDEDEQNVVTLHKGKLVNGSFVPSNIVHRSNQAIIEPKKFVSKNQEIKARYGIPQSDPAVDPSWCVEERSPLESVIYAFSVWLDVIPKNLARVWSGVISREVTAPKRFRSTSLTTSEMAKLCSEYKKKKLSENNCEDHISYTPDNNVRKCMSSLLHW